MDGDAVVDHDQVARIQAQGAGGRLAGAAEFGQCGRTDHETARGQSVPQAEDPFERLPLPAGQLPGNLLFVPLTIWARLVIVVLTK